MQNHLKTVSSISVLLITVSACSSMPSPTHSENQQAAPVTEQFWEYPASQYPAMCMVFQSDGSLKFQGGFTYFNPSKWRHDNVDNTLVVSLGGDIPFPSTVAAHQLRSKVGALVGFEESRRELIYKVDATTPFISFGDFYFYHVQHCHAPQKEDPEITAIK